MEEKFNFCIGQYWGSAREAIGEYAYGSVIHYGTRKDAENLLEYVKTKSDRPYQICIVLPISEYERMLGDNDVEDEGYGDGHD